MALWVSPNVTGSIALSARAIIDAVYRKKASRNSQHRALLYHTLSSIKYLVHQVLLHFPHKAQLQDVIHIEHLQSMHLLLFLPLNELRCHNQ